MKKFSVVFSLLLLVSFAVSSLAIAGDGSVSTVGAGGYDLVSFYGGGPEKGSGFNQSVHNDVTYVFANEVNLKKFEKNPEKYLPQYGGYCAYGASW